MNLTVEITLDDGDCYPNMLKTERRFHIGVPWRPGDHEAETSLVEAIHALVSFGGVIGELHEELTQKYVDKLAPAEPEQRDPLAGPHPTAGE